MNAAKSFLPTAVAVLAVLASTAPARADHIDRVVVRDSAALVAAVTDLKAKNVAVLKFRVQEGDSAPDLRTGGATGVEMQNRIQNILVLTLDEQKPAFTLLGSTGEAAAAASAKEKKLIDWTTEEGRKKLFDLKLPVVWDAAATATPDAFVTGTVRVSKDYRAVWVDVVAFTRDNPEKVRTLLTLSEDKERGILADRSMLASLGQTFATSRDLKPTGKARDLIAPDISASDDVAKRKTEGEKAAPPGAVKLDVLLDGQAVPYKPDPSNPAQFCLTEPGKPGQQVTFRLKNTHANKLAVLLCVNGRNTIAVADESLSNPNKPRAKFSMWILEPGIEYSILGFLTDTKGTHTKIEVLKEDESAALYDALSPAVRGKLQLFVYGPKPPPVDVHKPDGTEPIPGKDTETLKDESWGAAGLASSGNALGDTKTIIAAKKKLLEQTKLNASGNNLATNRRWAGSGAGSAAGCSARAKTSSSSPSRRSSSPTTSNRSTAW